MEKLEYKILPCIFCTIGRSCYVAGHNLVHAGVNKLATHKSRNNIDSNKNSPLVGTLPEKK